jgi:hypothetical protein
MMLARIAASSFLAFSSCPVAQAITDPVATQCIAKDRGHQLQILASNLSGKRYHCVSICYYRQNSVGFTGHWQSDYVVPSHAKDTAVATLKRHSPMTISSGLTTHCSPK